MSDGVVRLSFPAKSDYLLLTRLALSGLARSSPIPDELLADLKLAVTEACGNVVRHAYPDAEGDVVVSYAVDGDRLVVTIEDQGVGIERDGWDGATSSVTQHDGGMGMAIMRAVVDDLVVSAGADGRGTVVRMTTSLALPPSGAAAAETD
jgi:serine/threonine-protein kinase RsbW